MATIKDIAKTAGVSHGTVSNVLNGRGNVSVEKIKLVEKAARELGYKLNAKAQVLRQGKNNTVAVIIPSTVFQHYADLYEVLQRELKVYQYSVQLYPTNSLEITEERAIEDALTSRVSAIVSVSCLKDINLKYRVEASDIPIIFVDSDTAAYHENTIVTGFDYQSAGQDIGSFLLAKNAQNVAIFTPPKNTHHISDFLQGFHSALYGHQIAVTVVSASDYLASVQAFELFEQDNPFDYIVCSDLFRQQAATAAHSFSSQHPLPKFITISSRRAISDSNALIYELDYKNLGHKIVKRLIRILEHSEKDFSSITLKNSGFKYIAPLIQTYEQTLNFLTVTSPSSVALARLLPHCRKKTGINVNLTVLGLDELYDVASSMDSNTQYDLVRMDMAWMSELASKLYAPLHTIPYNWDGIFDKILPVFMKDYTSCHNVRYCLPYDPSTQILFYRKDLFENSTVKRMFYEQYHEELTIPVTFEQYNHVANFFTQSINPQSPVKFGTTIAIGSSVVNPSEYLPRLFGSGSSLFDQDGKINLETPAALDALENYIESYEYSDKTVYRWWKNALEGFADGSIAMTIVFMNHASDIINSRISSIAGKIGFAMIPDSKPLLGGGVIGINRNSTNQDAACKFLEWLYSDDVASVFTLLGGLSPCKTVYNNRDVLDLYPWLSAAKNSFAIGQCRLDNNYYNNFSEKKLEQIIGIEVQNAVMGTLSPQEALHNAQKRCESVFTR